MKTSERLTIVTVVKNASGTIQDTLNSVRRQTEKNFEYIVVDGQSTDGTLEILAQHSDLYDRLVSEPDDGIYSAWNKGIELSTGTHIIFLNADDVLLPDTVELALLSIRDAPKSLNIGSTVLFKDKEITGISDGIFERKRLPKGFSFLTTAVIFPASTFETVGKFDESYKLAADVDWLIRADLLGVKYQKSGHQIRMSVEGASNKYRLLALGEYRRALKNNGQFGLAALYWHFRKLAKCYVISLKDKFQ